MVRRWHPPHGTMGAALWVTSLTEVASVTGVRDTLWDAGEQHLGIARGLPWDA